MKDLGKRNVLGVLVDAVDYEAAVSKIVTAAREGRGFTGTATAVHGLMVGVQDRTHRYRLNHFDLVTPDGQGVRWALNLLYAAGLPDRVYGPRLFLEVCVAAESEGLPVYLYGNRPAVLDQLVSNLKGWFPRLVVAGAEPSKFRRTSPQEKAEIVRLIRASGARITFVGLGCPRQEVFAYEYREALSMPLLAVGSAFDFHVGRLREPSPFIQRAGLQWVHRLIQEPRRLWRRYLFLNPMFATLLLLQASGLWQPNAAEVEAPPYEVLPG